MTTPFIVITGIPVLLPSDPGGGLPRQARQCCVAGIGKRQNLKVLRQEVQQLMEAAEQRQPGNPPAASVLKNFPSVRGRG